MFDKFIAHKKLLKENGTFNSYILDIKKNQCLDKNFSVLITFKEGGLHRIIGKVLD